MSGINSPRRYCLLKSQYNAAIGEDGLRDAWLGKQAGVAGTPLPLDFPHAEKLATAHYTTTEDLTGADVAELVRQGLTRTEASAVLAALS